MSDQDLNLTPAEQELSRALGTLRPAALDLPFDRLAFEALQRHSTRQLRLWRATAALLAIGLAGVVLMSSGGNDPAPSITAHAPTPTNQSIDPPAIAFASPIEPGRADYLRLRSAVLRDGLDALPAVPTASPGRVLSVRDGSGV